MSLPTGQLSVEHIPPRLVEAAQGWYFVFYQVNPTAGGLERHRITFNINRIKAKKARRERAKELLAHLEELMKVGYPYGPNNGKVVYEIHRFIASYRLASPVVGVERVELQAEAKAAELITETIEIACRGLREDTSRTYRSRTKLFVAWLEKKGWADWPISEIKTAQVLLYMDEVRMRVNNTTYNNYRRELGIIFSHLKKRGHIKLNPVSEIPTVAKVKKMRRAFEPDEAAVVLNEAYKTDYWLFLMMLLHCLQLFRKTECLRLRFRSFNLAAGQISLSEDDTKNHQACAVAIPDEAIPFFLDNRFGAWPQNYLLFGKDHKPHASVPGGKNTYMDLHRNLLLRLKKEGTLKDIAGLSLYSWKDTGMTLLAGILSPMKLKDHARHSTLDTTLRYYHGRNLVQEVKTAKISLLDGLGE